MDEGLSLIGRDRVLVDKLGGLVHKAARVHECTDVRELPRGCMFDVRILDANNREFTGHVARVTVELVGVFTSAEFEQRFGAPPARISRGGL